MKLNADCVREVLLYIEEYTYITMDDKRRPVKHILSSGSVISTCEGKGFSAEDAFYSIYVLAENGYIDAHPIKVNQKPINYDIDNLTLKGHELLDSIRDEEVYSRTKDVASKMGGLALDGLATAAKVVGKTILKEKFGIDVDI